MWIRSGIFVVIMSILSTLYFLQERVKQLDQLPLQPPLADAELQPGTLIAMTELGQVPRLSHGAMAPELLGLMEKMRQQQVVMLAQIEVQAKTLQSFRKQMMSQSEETLAGKQALEAMQKDLAVTRDGLTASNLKVASLELILKAREAREDNERAKLKKMGKMYSTLAPEKAAAILKEMDDKKVATVLGQLKTDEAAQILGYFTPKRAAIISNKMIQLDGGPT